MELLTKDILRASLKMKRSAISSERRTEVREALVSSLFPLLQRYKTILSFHSLPDEIDTLPLNALLANMGKLLLPRVNGDALQIYQVNSPECDLISSKWGLQEPDPSRCPRVALETIDCVLVPGLAFDEHRHRVGYGKGHYDRFLAQLRQLQNIPLIVGIGFKEQLHEGVLPCEPHDIALDQVLCY